MNFNNFAEGDWQHFTYLALILVLLLSTLLTRRELPLPKVLKYLAIWSSIGCAMIIIYTYRFEFNDFKSRIIGEINPSSAHLNKEGQLILNLAQDGHFYIDVKINGKIVHFMIDTGASDIVLSLKDAKRVGINLDKLLFNKVYQTANGKSYGAYVNLEELEVAEEKFYDVSASVNNSPMGDSLLGMSFLRRLQKYEFYRDKLILTL